MPTAAVVIIGREILTGKFADDNGPYLIGRLRALGVDLVRMAVIDDRIDAIADEVRRCAAAVDHVFTTGGVGPTHDDVTFEGIAAAFGVPLVLDEDLASLLRAHGLGDPMNLRMATVPQGAVLDRAGEASFPTVRVRNVIVMPGIPALVRQKFEALAPSLAGTRVRTLRVYARDRESDVAGALAAIDAAHPAVEIGSYPRFGEGEHRLIVTAECFDAAALAAARDAIVAAVDVVRVEEG